MSDRDNMKQDVIAMLDGKLPDAAMMRILGNVDEIGVTPGQIAGAVDAIMSRAIAFPSFPHAVDCCGTGGDYQHTLNISTAAAFVVAACGVPVAKHGNRAITSSSGSADVLEALGVRTSLHPTQAEAILRHVGICFLFAPVFHPDFKAMAGLRKALGYRTIFNLLGPLCNPAKVNIQLIGVYDKKLGEPVAKAAKLLGRKQVMVVHGADGTDELSISGDTDVWQLRDGEITHHVLTPARAGLPVMPAKDLKGGDAEQNAAAMLEIFNGQENAYAHAVVYNAAALLYMSGKAPGLRGGATMAQEALINGSARAKLMQLIDATQVAVARA